MASLNTPGGDVKDCTLYGRYFSVAADNDVSFKLGGKMLDFTPNADGQSGVVTATVMPWEVEGLTIVLNLEAGDQEFLQERIDSGELGEHKFTLPGPAFLGGTGVLTGDLSRSTKTAVATVSLKGVAKLTQL